MGILDSLYDIFGLNSPETLPITQKMRLKSKYYSRLKGEWKEINISSESEWELYKPDMYKSFRKKFGQGKSYSGKEFIRWNDNAWEKIKPTLIFENEDKLKKRLKKAKTHP